MTGSILAMAGILLALLLAFAAIVVRLGVGWGATVAERSAEMPGDAYFTERLPHSVVMTRAISIAAPPDMVWPWLAQLGRGAGWYSYDRLDNGGKMSARHIVSWVPPPELGDASPIGYLRHLLVGRELTWWASGVGFLGATARLAVDMRLTPQPAPPPRTRRGRANPRVNPEPVDPERPGSRLVIRMSADAEGRTARPALWVFRFIDSIMARCQLLSIQERVEAHRIRAFDPRHPEATRDQFQLYEVIYASGERAGRPGKELAERWRRAAVEAGLVNEPES